MPGRALLGQFGGFLSVPHRSKQWCVWPNRKGINEVPLGLPTGTSKTVVKITGGGGGVDPNLISPVFPSEVRKTEGWGIPEPVVLRWCVERQEVCYLIR